MRDDFSDGDFVAAFLVFTALYTAGLLLLLKLCRVPSLAWSWVYTPVVAAVLILIVWIVTSLKSN